VLSKRLLGDTKYKGEYVYAIFMGCKITVVYVTCKCSNKPEVMNGSREQRG
jgi:hypothetical protein